MSDDLIQDYFENESNYVSKFAEEVEILYQAASTEEEAEMKKLARLGTQLLKQRQNEFLSEKNKLLAEIDNIFLTMEGIGQYMITKYLQTPEGGGFSKETAIKATRRGKSWWSQEEGLALVLLYERLHPNPDWRPLFSKTPENIVTLIEKELWQEE